MTALIPPCSGRAVSLDVRRQSGTNTVRIIDNVKRELARIEKTLPPGLDLRIIRDQSVFINASIDSLEEHLLFGSLLASLVVFLFIRSPRSVLIASLAEAEERGFRNFVTPYVTRARAGLRAFSLRRD
jgi:multidrug efflux pump subunit AcrB